MSITAILIMWAFGLIAGAFPLVGYFEVLFRIKGKTEIKHYFGHGLTVGLIMSLALVYLSTIFLVEETAFTFLTLSPYMVAGFETSAYWVSLFYSKRGKSLIANKK